MSWKSWMVFVGIAAIAAAPGCGRKSESGQGGKDSSQGGKVREAAVAGDGLFYPSDAMTLAGMIDGFLATVDAEPLDNLRGLICPHAGYRFSGPTAAYSYKQLLGRDVETVVVMAPSHYAEFRGASIPDVAAYRTPLGLLNLSPKAKELAKTPPFYCNPPCRVRRPSWWTLSPKKAPPPGEDTPHTWEHSLEVQLPFLQRVLKDLTIIPIVFAPEEFIDVEAAAKLLVDHLDEKTVFIASSDLSHFYSYNIAKQKDQACVKAICDLNIEAMRKQEACGRSPILTLMHIAKQKGWKTKLLDYRNSGDTSGQKSSVVGYAAIAFYEPKSSGAGNQ